MSTETGTGAAVGTSVGGAGAAQSAGSVGMEGMSVGSSVSMSGFAEFSIGTSGVTDSTYAVSSNSFANLSHMEGYIGPAFADTASSLQNAPEVSVMTMEAATAYIGNYAQIVSADANIAERSLQTLQEIPRDVVGTSDIGVKAFAAETLERKADEIKADLVDPDHPHSTADSLARLQNLAEKAGLQDLPAVREAEEQFGKTEESNKNKEQKVEDRTQDTTGEEGEEESRLTGKSNPRQENESKLVQTEDANLEEQKRQEEVERKKREDDEERRRQQEVIFVLQPELNPLRVAMLIAAGKAAIEVTKKGKVVNMRRTAASFEPLAQQIAKSSLAHALGLLRDGTNTAIAQETAEVETVSPEQLPSFAQRVVNSHTGVKTGFRYAGIAAPEKNVAEVTGGARRLAGMF